MLRRMWTFGERSDLAPVYAVVLAAGKRTRLRPLTDDKPKVLVEVNGTLLIEDVFDNLIDAGATEVVVGYKPERIIDRFGDVCADVPITYTHQREQLGLAHATLQAEPPSTVRSCSCSATTCSAGTSAMSPTASRKTTPTPRSSSKGFPNKDSLRRPRHQRVRRGRRSRRKPADPPSTSSPTRSICSSSPAAPSTRSDWMGGGPASRASGTSDARHPAGRRRISGGPRPR